MAPLSSFLSTPSARRATADWQTDFTAQIFLSTPSARRATYVPVGLPKVLRISIHALREEGDFQRAEASSFLKGFLSTPSARRATWCRKSTRGKRANFYPRPPRGGRLDQI